MRKPKGGERETHLLPAQVLLAGGCLKRGAAGPAVGEEAQVQERDKSRTETQQGGTRGWRTNWEAREMQTSSR